MNHFIIRRSTLPAIEGKLLLIGMGKYGGHRHSLESVAYLLRQKVFRDQNPALIPVFETAKGLMENDQECEKITVEQQ